MFAINKNLQRWWLFGSALLLSLLFVTLFAPSANAAVYGGDVVWVDKNTVKVNHFNIDDRSAELKGGPQRYEAKNVGVSGNCERNLVIEISQEQHDAVWQDGNPAPIPVNLNDGIAFNCGVGGSDVGIIINDAAIRFQDEAAAKQLLGSKFDQTAAQTAQTEENGDPADPNAQQSCENDGGEFSFFICPALRTADGIFSWLDGQITRLLLVPDEYTNSPGLEATWGRLRNLAYIILIPVMLFMVISTALGFEAVSAYTVKRAIPRLFIAVIFIALSFPLLQFLVSVTNQVGSGIYGLMTGLVSPDPITLASLFDSNGGNDTGSVFIGAIALAGVATFISIGILLSYAFVTIVSLIVGLFLLALRQMLIIMLLLLAPLAILSWIFPGNDKLWKLWWGSFSKLLILYPLIMILIAAGRIFAYTVHQVNGPEADGLMQTGLKLLGYVGPYFFIPAMFKFAGGAFATLTGAINDRSRGLFDRQRKYRGQKMSQNYSEFKTGDKAWRPKSFNNLGTRVGAGWKGRFGVGKRGAAFRDIQRRETATELQKDPTMGQLQFDDDGIMALALSGGSKAGAYKALRDLREQGGIDWDDQRISKAVATASIGGFSRSRSAAAIDMMGANKSFSLPGGAAGIEAVVASADAIAGVTRRTKDEYYSATDQEVLAGQKTTTDVKHKAGTVISGDKAMSDNIMGSFEYKSRGSGRMDLGMHDYATGKSNLSKAWEKATLAQHAQSAGPSLGEFAKDAHHQLFNGATEEDRKQAAIRILEMQSTLPYAHAANQDTINQLLSDVGVSFKPGAGSVEEQLAKITGIGTTGSALRGRARTYDQQEGRLLGDDGTPRGGATGT